MTSEAMYDPPGLSTRNTIALIDGSSRAFLIASAVVSDPMVMSPVSGLDWFSPRATPPSP